MNLNTKRLGESKIYAQKAKMIFAELNKSGDERSGIYLGEAERLCAHLDRMGI